MIVQNELVKLELLIWPEDLTIGYGIWAEVQGHWVYQIIESRWLLEAIIINMN